MTRRARAPWEPADPIRFVVVEVAADFPDLVASGGVEAETEVVQQTVGDERPAEIALRAVRRLATIERTGRHVSLAILAVSRNDSRSVWSTRELIARTVIRHMHEGGGGRLLFSCHGGVDEELRSRLLELGHDLVSELESANVTCVVHFSGEAGTEADAPAKSGVRVAVRASVDDDEREVG